MYSHVFVTMVQCIYAMNKIDTITLAELDIIDQLPHYVPISARDHWNLDELLERIWEYLKMVRIYTKPKGQIPDYNEPVVLRTGRSTVARLCVTADVETDGAFL